jgi:hypothetical protein
MRIVAVQNSVGDLIDHDQYISNLIETVERAQARAMLEYRRIECCYDEAVFQEGIALRNIVDRLDAIKTRLRNYRRQ